MTDEQRYHQLLVDAICGVGFPSVVLAQECEQVGLAEYNLYYQRYEWDRKALFHVSVEQLQELYEGLCDEREKNMVPTDPVDDYTPQIMLAGA